MSFDTLPVILVSSANQTTATSLISELVDNDVTDDYYKDTQSPDRVWRLVNKYYTANVRVHPLADDGRLDVDPNVVEAYIIHITEEEVLTALFFYATGSYQRPVGVAKNVSQKMCSVYIEQVTKALTHKNIFRKYIRFPNTSITRQTISQRFCDKYGIPGVIGCIDCSHFRIFGPPKDEEHLYYCRKHYHSINVQMLKDGCGALAVLPAESRAALGAGAWRRCGVRLVLVPGAREPAALCAWAAAARAELVPLCEPALSTPEPFGAAAGMGRARAALHAHAWRNLMRTDRGPRASSPQAREPDSSSSSGGSDAEEVEEERAVEHAEAFAAALGALGPALASRDLGADSHAPLDARHDRAEALVAAFCRALGFDLDAC